MLKHQIEEKLTALTADGKLGSHEGMDLLEQWIHATTSEEYGFVDEFVVPGGLNVVTAGGGRIIQHPATERVTTLFLFLHSGVRLSPEHTELMDMTDWRKVADTIYLNYDRGTRQIATEVAKHMAADSGQGYALAFYDISRVMSDANRITREEQMVEQSYRGEVLWRSGFDRDQVGEDLVDPFFAELEAFVKAKQPKFLFYVHSYDKFGGGVASGSHDKANGAELRPPSMIFDRHDLTENGHGLYRPDLPEVHVNLLQPKHIELVQQLQKQNLAGLVELEGGEVDVPVDYPYASPRQLPLLVATYHEAPQLVLEYRKDLFRSGREQINRAVLQIAAALGK